MRVYELIKIYIYITAKMANTHGYIWQDKKSYIRVEVPTK